MIVKGTYTSVWDGEIRVTTDVLVDLEDRTIEFLEPPKEIGGVSICTAEYIEYVKDGQEIEMPACQEDELQYKEITPSIYYTYE